ncbi:MAG: HAD family hydrolase [Haloarculaceae archaeon]
MTDDYDAVVYDLDGTLLRLDVDWDAVAREVAAALRARDVDVDGDLWAMLEGSNETGHRRLVEEIITDHEREGARTSKRLPLADELPCDLPVGVCSLNAESACRIALEVHGLDGYVGAVVGRDSVGTTKPDPEPLLATLSKLGVDSREVLFVGDSERDAETADRAGVDFEYAGQWLDRRRA